MQWITWNVLFKRIKAIKSFLADDEVPKRRKALIILGLFYLIMPIDFVPEPIFLVGIVDDLVLWGFILYYLKDQLDKYWTEETQRGDPEAKFKGKDIISDAPFEVDAKDEKE